MILTAVISGQYQEARVLLKQTQVLETSQVVASALRGAPVTS